MRGARLRERQVSRLAHLCAVEPNTIHFLNSPSILVGRRPVVPRTT